MNYRTLSFFACVSYIVLTALYIISRFFPHISQITLGVDVLFIIACLMSIVALGSSLPQIKEASLAIVVLMLGYFLGVAHAVCTYVLHNFIVSESVFNTLYVVYEYGECLVWLLWGVGILGYSKCIGEDSGYKDQLRLVGAVCLLMIPLRLLMLSHPYKLDSLYHIFMITLFGLQAFSFYIMSRENLRCKDVG